MNDHGILMAALATWFLWGVSWLAAAFWAGRSVGRAGLGSYGPHLALVGVGFGLLFAGPAVSRQVAWRLPHWLGWSLVGLVVAAFAFAWWARLHLGALWSAAIIRREGHRVVDSGPYALVRHPIYTALIAAALGLALVEARVIAVAGAVLIAVGFYLKARVEEDFLARELGADAYAAYRRQVPMLIPFLRS